MPAVSTTLDMAVKWATRQGNSSGHKAHGAGVYLTEARLRRIEEDLGRQIEGHMCVIIETMNDL